MKRVRWARPPRRWRCLAAVKRLIRAAAAWFKRIIAHWARIPRLRLTSSSGGNAVAPPSYTVTSLCHGLEGWKSGTMLQVSTPHSAMSTDVLALFCAHDPLLSDCPILVFHGPSTTSNSTLSSARIQAHVFTTAGFSSYPRITISPNAPLYAAVHHLPQDQQGDEVARGLAVAVYKYFLDLPQNVKESIIKAAALERGSRAPPMLDEAHAGELAGRMVRVENAADVLQDIQASMGSRVISNLELDIVLPTGSIQAPSEEHHEIENDPSLSRYGVYAPLVQLFGLPVFIPTSRLKRAPSRPTNLNRSKLLSASHKKSLRRELCEFVDTERRYLFKIEELLTQIAQDFQPKATSLTPNDGVFGALFPSSLKEIFRLNADFLQVLCTVLDHSEDDAIADIQGIHNATSAAHTHEQRPRGRDATGTLIFAKTLLDWFPKFKDCYSHYLQASNKFNSILTELLCDAASDFTRRVGAVGEQQLRSLLIEPVQRLPRYSLFIDNIANLLPAAHPALQPLMKSRDIITEICSLDSSAADSSQTINRLQHLVTKWPSSLRPKGRLITAADYYELQAPFRLEQARHSGDSIMLLFCDCMVLVQKKQTSNLTARGVLAEIDKLSTENLSGFVTTESSDQQIDLPLTFLDCFALETARFSEAYDGAVTIMTPGLASAETRAKFGRIQGNYPGERFFYMLSPYEGRASKWTEDITKARIEGRFCEAERESGHWELRTSSRTDFFRVFASIYDTPSDSPMGKLRRPAMVEMVVDGAKITSVTRGDYPGVEISVSAKTKGDGTYQLEIKGPNNSQIAENLTVENFINVLGTKLAKLLPDQYQLENKALTPSILFSNRNILNSLELRLEGQQSNIRSGRPKSPKKIISNFFSSGSRKETGSPSKKRTPLISDAPDLSTPKRTGSQKPIAVPPGREIMPADGILEVEKSMWMLEQTFTTYALAIDRKSGELGAMFSRARIHFDERSVNDVYNALLADASLFEYAVDTDLDYLFAAFEKFIRFAWKAMMGPVIRPNTLRDLHERCSTLLPGDFASYFKGALGDMAPQNQRAFRAIIRLLGILLRDCGNDADRGALTAKFADLLMKGHEPYQYIPLLDRLVEDSQFLFEDLPGQRSGGTTPATGSISSSNPSLAVNNGSMSSNASSLRRRLGLSTPSRSNSKLESEPKASSVWRTLSSKARSTATNENTPSSLSKASMVRSRSTDTNARSPLLTVDNQRDRPAVLGSFAFENNTSRPSSSHVSTGTEDSEASTVILAGASWRHKRRSSLSDLPSLQDAAPASTPLVPSVARHFTLTADIYSSPRTPSPVKPAVAPQPTDRKENSPSAGSRGTLLERAHNIQAKAPLTTTPAPPQKLRLQSPEKVSRSHRPPPLHTFDDTSLLTMIVHAQLRERLQSEKAALAASLAASDARAKNYDALYRAVVAENDELYRRFNEELVKLAGGSGAAGGAGAGVEMGRVLKEREDEMRGLRREVAKLRRENAGLRAGVEGRR
ncbi:MAG: hypothetical protein M1833_001232 [Piccolia ochrophora]|nr:MAG: hypothetical protein M1833_001232 [Piccolia ochrophora]